MNIDVKKVKIIVMVPSENTQELREAICTEGAGVIGNYYYCTTSTKAVGTFKPSKMLIHILVKKKSLNLLRKKN